MGEHNTEEEKNETNCCNNLAYIGERFDSVALQGFPAGNKKKGNYSSQLVDDAC